MIRVGYAVLRIPNIALIIEQIIGGDTMACKKGGCKKGGSKKKGGKKPC